MLKRKKVPPIERLRKNNKFLRSHIALGMFSVAGIAMLLMALRTRELIKGIFLESDDIGVNAYL
jgi:hypothetical protein